MADNLKIIGFSFSKLNSEKMSSDFQGLKIERNISVVDVSLTKTNNFQMKDEVLEIKFDYLIDYSPKIAKFEFSGSLLATGDSKTIKEFLKDWKDKKFPEKHRVLLFNVIMRKSDLKALEFEDVMGLPLHITLPFIKEQKK